MIRALYTAASGMSAQQTNLDTIANNLANSATAGFRQRQVQFEDMIYQNLITPGSAADATDSLRWPAGRPRNQVSSQRSHHDARRLQPDRKYSRHCDSRRRLLPGIQARRNHRLHASGQLPHEQPGNNRHCRWRHSSARNHHSLKRNLNHDLSIRSRHSDTSRPDEPSAARHDAARHLRQSRRLELRRQQSPRTNSIFRQSHHRRSRRNQRNGNTAARLSGELER